MSSLDSHTMVPSWTRLGRLTPTCCWGASAREAVATADIIALPGAVRPVRSARSGRHLTWQARQATAHRYDQPVARAPGDALRPAQLDDPTPETPMASTPAPAGHD